MSCNIQAGFEDIDFTKISKKMDSNANNKKQDFNLQPLYFPYDKKIPYQRIVPCLR